MWTLLILPLLVAQDPDREEFYDSLIGTERVTPVVRVVQAVTPAVVYIQTESTVRSRDLIFGARQYQQRGGGTGVVVHEDGYVVTNYHVVGGSDQISVSFAGDPVQYDAELLSYKQNEDLALLHILPVRTASPAPPAAVRDPRPSGGLTLERAPRTFPTVRMGVSSDLMPGEQVVAIGNPHGQTHTVSIGIISGLHRDVDVPSHGLAFKNLIQTDASINLGNSGGPLLNIRGELIGINTVMNQSAENIGFAIPVDRVREVLAEELFPNASRSWLGLDLASEGLPVVQRVWSEGPAAAAGICEGDTILALGDTRVETAEQFVHAALEVLPQSRVDLRLIREGSSRRAILTAWDKLDGLLFERAGLTVRQVGPGGSSAVIVSRLRPDGPAAGLGLRIGDLVPAIQSDLGRRRSRTFRIRDKQDLANVVAQYGPGVVLKLDVYRDEDEDGTYEAGERYTGDLELR